MYLSPSLPLSLSIYIYIYIYIHTYIHISLMAPSRRRRRPRPARTSAAPASGTRTWQNIADCYFGFQNIAGFEKQLDYGLLNNPNYRFSDLRNPASGTQTLPYSARLAHAPRAWTSHLLRTERPVFKSQRRIVASIEPVRAN